jgi:hypothetical protein
MGETTQQTPTQKTADDIIGGWRDVKSEQLAPTLGYDALSRGMIVRFSETRKVQSRGRTYTLHRFFSRAGHGQPFELWGAAELNGKLKAVRPNGVVYLRYDGKQPAPDNPSQEVHTFTVREAPARADVTALLEQMRAAADGLDREIRLAADRERDRRRDMNQQGPGGYDEPPAHSDDDLPF